MAATPASSTSSSGWRRAAASLTSRPRRSASSGTRASCSGSARRRGRQRRRPGRHRHRGADGRASEHASAEAPSTSCSARRTRATWTRRTLSFTGHTNGTDPAPPSPFGSRYDGFQQDGILACRWPPPRRQRRRLRRHRSGIARRESAPAGRRGVAVPTASPTASTSRSLTCGATATRTSSTSTSRRSTTSTSARAWRGPRHDRRRLARPRDGRAAGRPRRAADAGSVWIISGHLPPIDAGCTGMNLGRELPVDQAQRPHPRAGLPHRRRRGGRGHRLLARRRRRSERRWPARSRDRRLGGIAHRPRARRRGRRDGRAIRRRPPPTRARRWSASPGPPRTPGWEPPRGPRGCRRRRPHRSARGRSGEASSAGAAYFVRGQPGGRARIWRRARTSPASLPRRRARRPAAPSRRARHRAGRGAGGNGGAGAVFSVTAAAAGCPAAASAAPPAPPAPAASPPPGRRPSADEALPGEAAEAPVPRRQGQAREDQADALPPAPTKPGGCGPVRAAGTRWPFASSSPRDLAPRIGGMSENPYDRPSDPAKRNSAVMTDGPERAAARAMLKATVHGRGSRTAVRRRRDHVDRDYAVQLQPAGLAQKVKRASARRAARRSSSTRSRSPTA